MSDSPASITFEAETSIPTRHGVLRFRAYTDDADGQLHLAVISGEPENGAIVRVHSECLTGEAFGSLKCECGPQLDASLEAIGRDGGIVLYLRGHEGRGIGLLNKLRAYALQEQGLDTVDANLALGLPADSRAYTAAAQMLDDLDISRIRLLTNNPAKAEALEAHGITIEERVPLEVGREEANLAYLTTKVQRMGHIMSELPQLPGDDAAS